MQHEHVMVQAGDTRLQGPQCLEQPVNMPSCTICLGIYLDRHENLHVWTCTAPQMQPVPVTWELSLCGC